MPFGQLLLISFALFGLAAAGFLIHRNVIMLLMFAELMLNAANIALAAFSSLSGSPEPGVFILAAFAVAAAEAGVGLAIIILVARRLRTLDIGEINFFKG